MSAVGILPTASCPVHDYALLAMPTAHFAILDILLLAAYFVSTLIIGFWKRRKSTEDYLIASRSLSLPVFVATLVATWYGGILAVGEFTYQYGLANWTTQGLPYY